MNILILRELRKSNKKQIIFVSEDEKYDAKSSVQSYPSLSHREMRENEATSLVLEDLSALQDLFDRCLVFGIMT